MEIDSRDVQRFLGIDRIRRDVRNLLEIPALLTTLEEHMATAREQLNDLSAKVDDLVADVRAAKDALEADRENLSEEGQTALDELTAKVDAFDQEVGDADGSDAAAPAPAPAPDEQTAPAPDTDVPAGEDGTGTGSADGGFGSFGR